jgi:hypothetical protein
MLVAKRYLLCAKPKKRHMEKVFFSLVMVFFLIACNNAGRNDKATADSLNRAPTIDTVERKMDTASYERNNVVGDSMK